MNLSGLRNYITTIFFFILITIVSLLPGSNEEKHSFFYFDGIDKVVHFCMYATLTFVMLNDYLKQHHFLCKRLILIGLSILCFSIIMELIQQFFIPLRSGDILDVAANSVGITISISTVYLYRKHRS